MTTDRLDAYGDPLPPHALARLGSRRWQHHGHFIRQLAFSSDSNTVYAFEYAVTAFDAATGRVRWCQKALHLSSGDVRHAPDGDVVFGVEIAGIQRTLDPETGAQTSFAKVSNHFLLHSTVSPDNASLCLVGADADSMIVEPDFTLRATLPTRGGTPRINYSPDGQHLAVVDPMGKLALYAVDGSLVHTFLHNTPTIAVAAPLSGGTHVLTAHHDGALVRRSIHGEQEEARAATTLSSVMEIVTTRDNQYAIIATYTHVSRWRIDTLTREVECAKPIGMAQLRLSPDERSVVTSANGRVVVLDAVTLTERAPLNEASLPVHALRYTHDGKALVAASDDGQLRWWSDETYAALHTERLTTRALALRPTHDRSRVVVSPGNGTDTEVVDLDARTLTKQLDAPKHASGWWEGRTVRAWLHPNALHLRNAEGVTHALRGHVVDLAFTPDETHAVFLQREKLVVWSLATHAVVSSTAVRMAAGFTLSPDGSEAVVWGSMRLHRVPVPGGKAKAVVQAKLLFGMPVATYSPDGKLLAFGNAGEVWIVNAAGLEVARLQTECFAITALAFRPDGRELAVGAIDSTITLWDVGEAIARHGPPSKPSPVRR